MKKLILAVLISLLLIGTASAWEAKTMYVEYSASGNGQTLLYVDSDKYCHVMIAKLWNDGSTTSTASIHWDGTGSATNRLVAPMSLAAGEGVVLDLSKSGYFVIGEQGVGIEVDSSATTTMKAFIVYFLDTKKREGKE